MNNNGNRRTPKDNLPEAAPTCNLPLLDISQLRGAPRAIIVIAAESVLYRIAGTIRKWFSTPVT
jgi:hypothetical protein